MGSRKKKVTFRKEFQVISIFFPKDGIRRLVLEEFNHKTGRLTTYDKKRGKQKWSNCYWGLLEPTEDIISLPNLVDKMRIIHNA